MLLSSSAGIFFRRPEIALQDNVGLSVVV